MDSLVGKSILEVESISDILGFLSKDVYLHYLDRELLTSSNLYWSTPKEHVRRTFLYTLLSGNEKLYFSTSLVFENRFAEFLYLKYTELFQNNHVELAMMENSLQDFIYDKQIQFGHARDEYKFYFNDKWKELEQSQGQFRKKHINTTEVLHKSIIADLTSQGLIRSSTRLGLNLTLIDIKDINPRLIEAIQERNNKAVTKLLFHKYLVNEDERIVRAANLKVSEHYIKSYIEEYSGTIATGLQFPLSYFEYLSTTYPFRDTRLWRSIYQRLGLCNLVENLNGHELVSLLTNHNYIRFIDAVRIFIFKRTFEYAKRIYLEKFDSNDSILLAQIRSQLFPLLEAYPFRRNSFEEIIYCLKSHYNRITLETSNTPLEYPKSYHLMKNSKDLGIIIALKEEFQDFFPLINKKGFYDQETNTYFYESQIGEYSTVTTFVGEKGPTAALLRTERLLRNYKFKTIVNIGIAGSLDSDIMLGDVVVGMQIDGYAESAKIKDVGDDHFDYHFSGDVLRGSLKFSSHAENFQFSNPSEYSTYKLNGRNYLDTKVEPKLFLKLAKENKIRLEPEIKTGAIASGPFVSASKNFKKHLNSRNRDFKAIEMESYGILKSVESENCDRLILRAISDFADERKSNLDKDSQGIFRRYAMNNAINIFMAFVNLKLFEGSNSGNI